jgi:hypothetical protein
MKCPSCGNEWPDSVKFCGRCGTKLTKPPPAGGLPPKLAEVNEQLKRLLPKIGMGKFVEVQPGHHICPRGSTHVDVRVIDVGRFVAVRSVAPVTTGSNLTPELMKFLLTMNAGFVYGAFGVGPKGEIICSHSICASSMDQHELGTSVANVAELADRFDDQIVQRWGGKTARQSAIDQFIAPALLKALVQAKLKGISTKPAVTRPVGTPRPAACPSARIPVTRGVSSAIKVNSVPEEYAYLRQQRCSCGGTYHRDSQSLLQIDGLYYDELAISCEKCGRKDKLLFDINSFHPRIKF